MESPFTIKRVNPQDEELFREAYDWSNEYPRWYREFENMSFAEFLEQARKPNQVDVGIFQGGLVALLTFRQVGKGTHEVHVLAKRGIDKELLIRACLVIRDGAFSVVEKYIGRVWRKNYGLLRIAKSLGFYQTGMRDGWVELECVKDGNETENNYIGDDLRDNLGNAVGNDHEYLRVASAS